MCITFKIDIPFGVVFSFWSGDVGKDEMARHWKTMLSNKDARVCGKSLVDLGNSHPDFNIEGLSSFVFGTVGSTSNATKWKSAIVARTPFQYGAARQYQVLVSKYIDVNVFTDEISALEWIRLPE